MRSAHSKYWLFLVPFLTILTVCMLSCTTSPPVPDEVQPGGVPQDDFPPMDPFPPLSIPEASSNDLLAPSDLLHITIHDYPDLETRIRIPSSGTIQLPLLGAIMAKGLSVPALAEVLRAAYEDGYLTSADVSISVVEYSPRKVYILGSVHDEGAYPIPTGKRLNLLQLLSLAGGFAEAANQDSLLVFRVNGGGESVRRVSYRQLISYEDDQRTPFFLVPDDTIIVGKEQSVYVLGRVNRPGAFPIGEGGLTVIQAVTLAGGFQRIASREGTIVIREPAGGQRKTYSVPVKSIVNDQRRRDFRLKPGDIVYVPEGIF